MASGQGTVSEEIDGQEFYSGPDGERYVLPVLITGIDKAQPWGVIAEAGRVLNAYQNPNYAMYSTHPRVAGTISNPTNPGFRLESRLIRGFGNAKDKARAILTYKNYNYFRVSVDGNVLRTTTRFDTSGEILTVRYDPNKSTTDVPGSDAPDPDYAEAPILRPLMTICFEYVIGASDQPRQQSAPLGPQQAKYYTGKTNSKPWQGGDPHTWLCLSFTATPLDIFYGRFPFHEIRSEFQFLGFEGNSGVIDSYDPVLIYNRRDTRRPPGNVDPKAGGFPNKKEGNGWKQARTQFAVDFKPLPYPTLFK